MSRLDVFHRVLESLHEATLDDAHWPAASAQIDEACRVKGNQLIVGEGSGSNVRVFFARNYQRGQRREDFERNYFLNYHRDDERMPRLRRLPDGQLVHVTELYTEQELKTSPTYNEALSLSNGQQSLNVRMDGPHGSRIVWALADPVQKDGWWSDQIEMAESLLPHIRQFVCVRQALAEAKGTNAALGELLGNSQIGVIQIDRRGRIHAVNDLALDLLRLGDGLRDQDGFLRARLSADNARLQRLLRAALPNPFGSTASGSLTIQRPPGLPPLEVHLSPVGGGRMNFGGSKVAALALVIDPHSQPSISPEVAADALRRAQEEDQGF